MTDIANAVRTRADVHYIDRSRDLAPASELTSVTIPIKKKEDIVAARLQGRLFAQKLDFSTTQTTLVVTVISELARNILLYAGRGEIILTRFCGPPHEGLQIKASDQGPGIEDIPRAISSGYSSSGGLGLGLSGIRQMVDEFDISSSLGSGTQVTGSMWSR